MGNVRSVFGNSGPCPIQLLSCLAKCLCGLVMSRLGGMALFQGQLLFHYMSQQFGLCLGGLLEQFPALDKTHFKGVHIFSHYPADDVLQTDTRILRHQEIIEEGTQLVIIITSGVCPSLVVSHGHINPMEPGSESLDSGFTEDADILRPQLLIVEIHLQWRQLCLHNLWQHWGAHARRGASRSEVKLSNGETQHIGEVHQLLLGFVGEVCFEAVIDPLG